MGWRPDISAENDAKALCSQILSHRPHQAHRAVSGTSRMGVWAERLSSLKTEENQSPSAKNERYDMTRI